jgi:tetratricopeptide (TPR) repeat protein
MAELSQYLPRLPFDTLAQFEATSGLMILNVDLETFQKSAANYATNTPTSQDIELYSIINHETYHYFQTLATGYQYLYASEMWRLILDEAKSQTWHGRVKRWKEWVKIRGLQAYALTILTGMNVRSLFASETWPLRVDQVSSQARPRKFKRLKEWVREKAIQIYVRTTITRMIAKDVKRFTGFQTLVRDQEKARTWEKSAHDDLSLLSANLPLLSQGFERLWARMKAPNGAGLSAIDLIEGSAIVFEHLLTHGREGLDDRLAKAWDAAGASYRRAFDVAQEICGARALDIMLPAIALALRYSNPPEAYPVLLKVLNASSPGTEISEARAVASIPPRIRTAGAYLGTALDVRRKQLRRKSRYTVYDDVLDKLEKRAWGFDEIDLLSDRGPAQKVDSFPFVTVVKEGPLHTNNLDPSVLTKRLVCGNLVLRTAKLPRFRRSAEKRLMDRMHPIAASLFDPMMAANEYNQLGLNYLNEGDVDQAEVMMKLALSIYVRHQHEKGIARQLYNLGLVYAARNDRDGAQEMYRESLAISEKIEDPEGIALAAANLGHQYMQAHRLEEAEALIRKALTIEARLGLKEGVAIDYCNLGRIYFARKDVEHTREFLTKAAELYRAVGKDNMANSIEEQLANLNKTPQNAVDST